MQHLVPLPISLLGVNPESVSSTPLAPSKRDIELLLKLIANLNMLLRDENVNVVKKAILTMTQLYRVALQVRWLHPTMNSIWRGAGEVCPAGGRRNLRRPPE